MAHCAKPTFHCMPTPWSLHTAIQNENVSGGSAKESGRVCLRECVLVRRERGSRDQCPTDTRVPASFINRIKMFQCYSEWKKVHFEHWEIPLSANFGCMTTHTISHTHFRSSFPSSHFFYFPFTAYPNPPLNPCGNPPYNCNGIQ